MSQGNSPYRIVIAGSARRRLAKLGRKERDRIDEKVIALATDPRPNGVEKLTGQDRLFRVRVGRYRVVYGIDDEERVVTVEDVRGRDDIYRKKGGCWSSVVQKLGARYNLRSGV